MTTALQIFNSKEFGNIRVIIRDGEPWFVGKDIATALGYVRTADAVREHVPDKFKGVGEMETPGGKQNVVVINEAGLYKLTRLHAPKVYFKKYRRFAVVLDAKRYVFLEVRAVRELYGSHD